MIRKFFLLILFTIIAKEIIYASSFLGVGSGFQSLKLYNENLKSHNYIPIILEYEYSKEYRDQLIFYSSINYYKSINNENSNDMFIFDIGLKYVPKVYYYKGNYTEKAYKEYGCFSFILMPLTVMRDSMINAIQLFIPQQPFLVLSFAGIIELNGEKSYGFSIAQGLTNGFIDYKLKYTQNIKYCEHLKTDFFIIGFEITFHFPLQEKFVRMEPLLE